MIFIEKRVVSFLLMNFIMAWRLLRKNILFNDVRRHTVYVIFGFLVDALKRILLKVMTEFHVYIMEC